MGQLIWVLLPVAAVAIAVFIIEFWIKKDRG